MGVIQSSVEPGSLGASTPHTYQYDQQYRLTSDKVGSNPLQGSTSTWQLDAATEITRTTSFVALSGVNTISTRTYDAANELKSLLETQGSTTTKNYSFTYNSRGDRTQLYNKVNGATTTYGYDQAERLTSSGAAANPTNYRYNGDGVRMSKATGLSSNSYVWDAGQDLLQEGGSSTSYIYGPGGMLVEQIQASTPYYYHADQLGSVRAITNSSGAVSNTYTYDAYGNTSTSTGTVANPFKYSGQYTDSESGSLYLRARYYDPATQQFLSVDPLVASTEQAYNYVGGSPVNNTDPSGLDANCSWWPNPFDEHSCMREGFDTPAGKWVAVGGVLVATGGIACVAGGCEAAGAAIASPWTLPAFERGVKIENMLGRSTTLTQNFPTIDRFENGLATSIKSLDLNAPSYQSISTLTRTVQGYCNTMSNWAGQARPWGGITILPGQIGGRAVDLAIPTTGTAMQLEALQKAQQYATNLANPVTLNVIQIR